MLSFPSSDCLNMLLDFLKLFSLIRYSKDIAQLDLVKCKQWNRFLEVN